MYSVDAYGPAATPAGAALRTRRYSCSISSAARPRAGRGGERSQGIAPALQLYCVRGATCEYRIPRTATRGRRETGRGARHRMRTWGAGPRARGGARGRETRPRDARPRRPPSRVGAADDRCRDFSVRASGDIDAFHPAERGSGGLYAVASPAAPSPVTRHTGSVSMATHPVTTQLAVMNAPWATGGPSSAPRAVQQLRGRRESCDMSR